MTSTTSPAATSSSSAGATPQPRGRRRGALPREDGGRPRGPRRPGHHPLRGPRGRAPGRDRRRRPLPAPRHQAQRLQARACSRSCAASSAASTSSWTCRTGCRSSPGSPPAGRSSCSCTTCTASSGRSSTPGSAAGSAGGSSAGSPRGSTAPASTSRCPAPPGASCAASAWTATADRGRPQRHRPGRARSGPARRRTPMVVRGGPAGPAQAGRARHRRRASSLRESHPGLRLHVVGSGWWEATLHEYAAERGRRRHRGLRGPRRRAPQARGLRARLAAGAALAQGGLGAGDRRGRDAPAPRRSPTGRPAAPASRSSTDAPGVLVDDQAGLRPALGTLLADDACRERLGRRRPVMSHQFTWEHAQESFAQRGRARVLATGGVDSAGPVSEQ